MAFRTRRGFRAVAVRTDGVVFHPVSTYRHLFDGLLGSSDALHRTDFSAGTAIGALFGVDDKNGITLADGLFRTFGLAGRTGDAFFGDDVCHEISSGRDTNARRQTASRRRTV